MKKIRNSALCFLLFLSISVFASDLASKLTIITTSSPCVSYPRSLIIMISQYSMLRTIPEFQSLPKIIVCDGVRDPMQAKAYEEYKVRLRAIAATHPHFQNTTLVFCEEWKCLAGALKEAFEHVKTEYVLVHQDDFEFLKPLDLHGLLDAMDKNHNLKHVRLNSSPNPPFLGGPSVNDAGVHDQIEGGSSFPLLTTHRWSDNDHIARTDYYTGLVFPLIGEEKTFMEHVMNGAEGTDLNADLRNHSKYGTFLYGTWGDGPFIYHLDRHSTAW